jgi:mRNA interferase MazF
MRRGELYRVARPTPRDPKKYRVFVIVSRQALMATGYSTVICAPVYSSYHGLITQVPVDIEEGLTHSSSIHCDDLVSLPKSVLTDFIGVLSPVKIDELNEALKAALDLPD